MKTVNKDWGKDLDPLDIQLLARVTLGKSPKEKQQFIEDYLKAKKEIEAQRKPGPMEGRRKNDEVF